MHLELSRITMDMSRMISITIHRTKITMTTMTTMVIMISMTSSSKTLGTAMMMDISSRINITTTLQNRLTSKAGTSQCRKK